MTRVFCGMWQYTTQIMDFNHIESFLARLIVKRGRLVIAICDKQGYAVAGARYTVSDIYKVNQSNRVAGLVLYHMYYRVKIDSLKNVSLVPVYY